MHGQHIEDLQGMLWSTDHPPTPRQSVALTAAIANLRKSAGAHAEALERARNAGRTEGYEAAADEVRDANAHAEAFKADVQRIESALRRVCEAADVLLARHSNEPPATYAALVYALEQARALITPPTLTFTPEESRP